jgi:hypothetical protein
MLARLASSLVGISRYDRGESPRTGGVFDPDAAAIAALRPDLLVALGQQSADSSRMIRAPSHVRIVPIDGGLLDHPGPLLLDGLARLKEEVADEP